MTNTALTFTPTQMLVDGLHGIHCPKIAIDRLVAANAQWDCPDEVIDVLKSGADHPEYWEAWEAVTHHASVTINSVRYRLRQDGDVWLDPMRHIAVDESYAAGLGQTNRTVLIELGLHLDDNYCDWLQGAEEARGFGKGLATPVIEYSDKPEAWMPTLNAVIAAAVAKVTVLSELLPEDMHLDEIADATFALIDWKTGDWLGSGTTTEAACAYVRQKVA
jgi:hypothetical protein